MIYISIFYSEWMKKLYSVFVLLLVIILAQGVEAQGIAFEPEELSNASIDSYISYWDNLNLGEKNMFQQEFEKENMIIYDAGDSDIISLQATPKKAAYFNESLEAACYFQNNKSYIIDTKWTRNNNEEVFSTNLKQGSLTMAVSYQCVIRENDSRLFCWGSANDRGQLGIGNTQAASSPQQVLDTFGYELVEPYYFHTCGIREDGRVTCWGRNDRRQLGIGTSGQRTSPTLIDDELEYKDISAGAFHSCGIRTNGQATCWGLGSIGRLGTGSNMGDQQTPVEVTGGHNFTQIDVGGYHACAIDDVGDVYCWGSGSNGRLGYGSTSNRASPTKIDSDKAFIEVKASFEHTCAITKQNEMYCWGKNTYGQLGTGGTDSENSPVRFASDSKVKSIITGFSESCGVTFDNQLVCSGRNFGGIFGSETRRSTLVPVTSNLDITLTNLDFEGSVACGLEERTGDLYCYGSSLNQVEKRRFEPYTFNQTYRNVTIGLGNVCGVHNDSHYCLGDNSNFQLGQDNISSTNQPTKIDVNYTLANVRGLARSYCGIRQNDNKTVCWGDNSDGQLGDGTEMDSATPVLVDTNIEFTDVQASTRHACGLSKEGKVYCWGHNEFRQFGDGSTSSSNTPVLSANNEAFDKIEINYFGGCGMRANTSKLRCWGSNPYGEVGDGSTSGRSTPVNIVGNHDYVDFWAGRWHNCGKRTDNKTYCWGYNSRGQLGDGSTSNRNSPREVNTDIKIQQMGLGVSHTCAISTNKSLYCWGNEEYFTPNSTGSVLTPRKMFENKTFNEVAVGSDSTCAVTVQNETICFGSNTFGQTGGKYVNPLQPSKINTSFSIKRSIDGDNVSSKISSNQTSVGDVWKYSCRAVNSSNSQWVQAQNITIHDGPKIQLETPMFREGVIERNAIQKYRLELSCLFDDCGDVNISIVQKTTSYKASKNSQVGNEKISLQKDPFDILFTTIQTDMNSTVKEVRQEDETKWDITAEGQKIPQQNYTLHSLKLSTLADIKGVQTGYIQGNQIPLTQHYNDKPIVLLTSGHVTNIANNSISIETTKETIGYAIINETGLETLNLTNKTVQSNQVERKQEFNLLQIQSKQNTLLHAHLKPVNTTHAQVKVCDENSCDVHANITYLSGTVENVTRTKQTNVTTTRNDSQNYLSETLQKSCLQNMSAFDACTIPIRIITKQQGLQSFELSMQTTSMAQDTTKNLSSYSVRGDAQPRTRYNLQGIDTENPESWDNTTLTIENQERGSIQWKNPVNITRRNFEENVRIEDNEIRVNSKALGDEYNSPAKIVFKNIKWRNPEILRDGQVCNDCELLSYRNDELEVEVPGFSTYTSRETRETSTTSSRPVREDKYITVEELRQGKTVLLYLRQNLQLQLPNQNPLNLHIQSFGTNYVNVLVDNQTREMRPESITIIEHEDMNTTIEYIGQEGHQYKFTIQLSENQVDIGQDDEQVEEIIKEESETVDESTSEHSETGDKTPLWLWLSLVFLVMLVLLIWTKNKVLDK